MELHEVGLTLLHPGGGHLGGDEVARWARRGLDAVMAEALARVDDGVPAGGGEPAELSPLMRRGGAGRGVVPQAGGSSGRGLAMRAAGADPLTESRPADPSSDPMVPRAWAAWLSRVERGIGSVGTGVAAIAVPELGARDLGAPDLGAEGGAATPAGLVSPWAGWLRSGLLPAGPAAAGGVRGRLPGQVAVGAMPITAAALGLEEAARGVAVGSGAGAFESLGAETTMWASLVAGAGRAGIEAVMAQSSRSSPAGRLEGSGLEFGRGLGISDLAAAVFGGVGATPEGAVSSGAALGGAARDPVRPVPGARGVSIFGSPVGSAMPGLGTDGTGPAGGGLAEQYRAPASAPREAEGQTGGVVMLDGRLVGQWMMDRMGREASRPPAGMTGFNARQGVAWSPSGVM